MLLAGLVPRKHILHTADSGLRLYVRLRLVVPVVGDGGGGTKEVGFWTLRPDLVMVTTGVATSLSLDSPSLPSSRLRFPPRPPPRPLPRGLPTRPRPRPDEVGVDCAASPALGAELLSRLTRFPPLPPRFAGGIATGTGIFSEVVMTFMTCSLAASQPGGLIVAGVFCVCPCCSEIVPDLTESSAGCPVAVTFVVSTTDFASVSAAIAASVVGPSGSDRTEDEGGAKLVAIAIGSGWGSWVAVSCCALIGAAGDPSVSIELVAVRA